MAKVQDLLEAAKGAVISGACDQAIAICGHLLRQYPKHLEAHCMLAEAYRERGDAAKAEDLFLRTLSADPERLIARWALSIIHNQRGERDAALKHLQIALELSPDHAELRRELVQMSGDKVKQSIGGLARLHLRGGLFDLAAETFGEALEREPQRLDLRLGLAEVLWRDGRDDQALEQCHKILEDSPDCLKATVLAALIGAHKMAPPAEIDRLLSAARALDPEDILVADLAGQADLAPSTLALKDEPATVPDLEDMAAIAAFLPSEPPAPVEAPAVGTPEPEPALAAAAQPGHAGAGTVPEIVLPAAPAAAPAAEAPPQTVALPARQASAEKAPDTPAFPLAGQAGAPPPSAPPLPPLAGDMPDWLERDATASRETSAGSDEWGEWASLLDEQITLDPGAEARLAAALSDMPAGDATGPTGGRSSGAAAADDKLSTLLQAVAADASNHDARLALAHGYAQAGRHDAAIAEFRALLLAAPHLTTQIAEGLQYVVRHEPRNPDGHRALGDAFMKVGRFQQAIDEYNQAVSLKS